MIIKGYPSQEKLDSSKQQVVTVQPTKNGQHGLETVASTTAAVIASDTVEAGSTDQVINATGHSAEPGDIIRFTTGGALFPREISVESVTTNTITLVKPAPSAPGTGDPFDIMRFFQETISLSGGSTTQLAFDRNTTLTVVTEDTGTPANNRPLPTKLFGPSANPLDTESLAAAQKTIATLTEALTGFSINMGWDGAIHREILVDTGGRITVSTRHEDATTPLAGRLTDGTDFISSEAIAASQKTVATLTKSIATLGITLGWDGTNHRELAVNTSGELTLDTRHEAVGTPLAGRLSDGTNFIGSEAIAAAQKTLATESSVLSTLSIGLGWDGTTHRELAVDTSGQVKTVEGSAAASFPAYGKVLGTALTGTYANVFTAAADIQVLFVFNSCDAAIIISLDGGTTDHYELEQGEAFTLDLGSNRRYYANTSEIDVKHAGAAPTTGSVRISAVV